jgi:hypothetical protein
MATTDQAGTTTFKSFISEATENVSPITTTTTQTYKLGLHKEATNLTPEWDVDLDFRHASREAESVLDGKARLEGSISFLVNTWWWLEWVLGVCSTAGAGPYTHSFTVGEPLPTFVDHTEILGGDGPFSWDIRGCKARRLSLELMNNRPVKATLGYIGRSMIDSISTTTSSIILDRASAGGFPILPATANATPFVCNADSYFKWDDGGLAELEGFIGGGIVFENSLDPHWEHQVTDEEYAELIMPGTLTCSGSMSCLFTANEKKAWTSGNDRVAEALEVYLKRAANDDFKLNISNAKIRKIVVPFKAVGEGHFVGNISWIGAKTLTSTVIDSIAGGLYGG